jgi:hypothetical protein
LIFTLQIFRSGEICRFGASAIRDIRDRSYNAGRMRAPIISFDYKVASVCLYPPHFSVSGAAYSAVKLPVRSLRESTSVKRVNACTIFRMHM